MHDNLACHFIHLEFLSTQEDHQDLWSYTKALGQSTVDEDTTKVKIS
jgi:hypothetical protein